MQEVEEARVPKLHPRLAPVELSECDEKIRHGSVLAANEIGQAIGKNACIGHGANIADGSDKARSGGAKEAATRRSETPRRGIARPQSRRAQAS
jgi:hypothetical protein